MQMIYIAEAGKIETKPYFNFSLLSLKTLLSNLEFKIMAGSSNGKGNGAAAAATIPPEVDQQLKAVQKKYDTWQTAFKKSTRDGLYELVAHMVAFAYVLGANKPVRDALYSHYDIELKECANPWTPFIKLIVTAAREAQEDKDFADKEALKPRDYQFANVIRWMVTHKVHPKDVVTKIKEKGGIVEIIKLDKAPNLTEAEIAAARNAKKAAAVKAGDLGTLGTNGVDVPTGLKEGYHEAIVKFEGGALKLVGFKPRAKEDPDGFRLETYVANAWEKRFDEPDPKQPKASDPSKAQEESVQAALDEIGDLDLADFGLTGVLETPSEASPELAH